ncbi:MAG: hypothetical protein R2939_12195 [Kofleriaceae bacterium]
MIPAIIIGGYTAWFLGLRAGLVAGVVSAVAIVAAGLVPIPGLTITVWALLLGWCALLFFFGRAMGGGGKGSGGYRASVMQDLGSLAARARRLVKR